MPPCHVVIVCATHAVPSHTRNDPFAGEDGAAIAPTFAALSTTAPVYPLTELTGITVVLGRAPTSEAVSTTVPVYPFTELTGNTVSSGNAPTSEAVSATAPVYPFTEDTGKVVLAGNAPTSEAVSYVAVQSIPSHTRESPVVGESGIATAPISEASSSITPVYPFTELTGNVVLAGNAPTSEAVRLTIPVCPLTEETEIVAVFGRAPTSEAVSY